jgi:hypothetical protein
MTQDLDDLGRQPWEKQKGGRRLHADWGGVQVC